jgi:hypothetical protein
MRIQASLRRTAVVIHRIGNGPSAFEYLCRWEALLMETLIRGEYCVYEADNGGNKLT